MSKTKSQDSGAKAKVGHVMPSTGKKAMADMTKLHMGALPGRRGGPPKAPPTPMGKGR